MHSCKNEINWFRKCNFMQPWALKMRYDNRSGNGNHSWCCLGCSAEGSNFPPSDTSIRNFVEASVLVKPLEYILNCIQESMKNVSITFFYLHAAPFTSQPAYILTSEFISVNFHKFPTVQRRECLSFHSKSFPWCNQIKCWSNISQTSSSFQR